MLLGGRGGAEGGAGTRVERVLGQETQEPLSGMSGRQEGSPGAAPRTPTATCTV